MADGHEFEHDSGDASDALVRPYVITHGRQNPANIELDLVSVVISANSAVDEMSLEPEQVRILDLCRTPLSVAEVASHLDVPVAVVKVLLGDLIGRGHVLARAPYTADNPVSRDLLQAVLNGIERL
ncbi:hypothetical protein F4561_004636 [Lipingzhangella halophila]|uniref:DUF742 domain-containing protein n=1 Tax=Lipingzhangella halophila TaxID=1783352 RepID=A0A7W7RKX1_9ACTN|nr:DUF742 domain-containing protein [Lipingzhangella halophila]MBB4933816.1 hypothetical protein [Lipingzhangella halophila]